MSSPSFLRLRWLPAREASPPSSRSRGADHELARRLGEGDVRALAEVYDVHHVALRAFARRLLSDDAAAEDLVHDTFVALPPAARRFRGDATLRTLVFSIAVKRAARFVRSAARRRGAVERAGNEPAHSNRTPEDAALHGERLDALLHALDTLSIDHRVVLVLCDVEERTSAEAASILGIPDGRVRSRLMVARQKLRERLHARELR